jgi:ATP-dependent helicase/nuclease subunit A
MLGLGETDAHAAASVAEAVFRHELLRRAAAAHARGACRRETPVSWTSAEGTMVEGVVDLAFEEQGRWVVVDYKTDRDIATDGLDRYRRQVAIYAAAIAQATGCLVRGVLVRL